jgi:hypothetical protein
MSEPKGTVHFNYKLDSVELIPDDMQKLWNGLRSHLGISEQESASLSSESLIIATSRPKKGRRETISFTDINDFLGNPRTPFVLYGLTLSLSNLVRSERDGSVVKDYRQVRVFMAELSNSVDVSISGQPGWAEETRAFLDSFLFRIKRDVRWRRRVSFFLWTFLPIAALFYLVHRVGIDYPYSSVIISPSSGVLALYFFLLSHQVFPNTLIITDKRGVGESWIMKWMILIWSGVIISLVVMVIVGLLA